MRVVEYRGKFYAYWIENGKSRRRALRTADRAAAERTLIDLQRKPTVGTVGGIYSSYLAEKDVERARFAWKRLAATFDHIRPDQVTRDLCRTYITARRKAGAQDGTILKELSFLRAALRWHDKNTPAVIEMPPSPPPKHKYLTRDQYRSLRDAARKIPHLYVFVVLAYSTAGRASAILELTWDRVDFNAGMIRLGSGERRAKGRATVPMTESARQTLLDAKRAAITDYVVEYAGRSVLSVKKAFAAAADRAGVPWCTPHVLRHTAAVHMVESGVSMEEVAQFLGHSSMAVTYRVYARFSPTYLRKAAAALE